MDKFALRAVPSVFMGYSTTTKGYILFDIDRKQFFINRDVTFREHVFPFQSDIEPAPPADLFPWSLDSSFFGDTPLDEPSLTSHAPPEPLITQPPHSSPISPPHHTDSSPIDTNISYDSPRLKRSQRVSKATLWHVDYLRK